MDNWIECIKDRSLHFSELIKSKLYFATVSEENLKHFIGKSNSTIHYLYVDDDFQYEPFFRDFGPLNLGMLYVYCRQVNALFKKKSIIVHLTTCDNEHRVNSAYLVGSYSIIYQKFTATEVMSRLIDVSTGYLAMKSFIPFVHAGFDKSQHYIYLEDCLGAIQKAMVFKLLDFQTFNVQDYHYYEKIENGDLNWIIPGKIIAFCDPQTYLTASESFQKYLVYFREKNVTNVIRLNRSAYNARQFTTNGIVHTNLIFLDGSNPTDRIMRDFLNICENARGAVAVHCKAGLGRTGTLIGCYLMKHYRFTALEAIAWLRICRPGSVVGPQQEWLESKQNLLWAEGGCVLPTRPADKCKLELQPSIIKCNIYEKQHPVAKAVASSQDTNKNVISSIISNINSIHFDEAGTSSSGSATAATAAAAPLMVPSGCTQGDILNALKRMRNKTSTKRSISNVCPLATASTSIDANNNFPPSSFTRSQVLRIYGKKIHKYPAFASRVLPH